MTDIENTKNRSAGEHLVGMIDLGQSGYLEQIEAQGQRSLVESAVLPRKIIHYTENDTDDFDPWTLLEELGFTRGKNVPGDPLFCNATLPEGWTKAPGENSLWSYVIDTRGLRRIGIFYKAVFYDRRAHMSITDVGQDMAVAAIYASTPPALPEKYILLTDAEKDSFAFEVDRQIRDHKRSPDIYTHGPRAAALKKLIES